MSDDALYDQLDLIVGLALKGLVDSGASPRSIGAFAASHRQEVARALGIEPSVPEAPDLQALVTEAVAQALSTAGKRKTKPDELKAQRFYVEVAGRRTSVSINGQLFAQLASAEGGQKNARVIIDTLAEDAPADVPNRSRWIESQIRQRLTLHGQPGAMH